MESCKPPTHQPDLVVLDLGLPDLDDAEVIRQVREWSGLPIIVVSAQGAGSRIRSRRDSMQGADDYLTKPFGIDELMARIRVALRHAAQSSRGNGRLDI